VHLVSVHVFLATFKVNETEAIPCTFGEARRERFEILEVG
jgi:hypothetical protein